MSGAAGTVTAARTAAARTATAGTAVIATRSAPGARTARRGTGPASAAGEGGLAGAVFQEAAHAGLLVLGAEQRGELHPLDLPAGGQGDAEAGVDGLLGGAQRERGAAGVAPRKVQGRLVDRIVRHYLVHQADLQRLDRADHPAAEHDVLGPGRADQAGQSLRSAG